MPLLAPESSIKQVMYELLFVSLLDVFTRFYILYYNFLFHYGQGKLLVSYLVFRIIILY